MTLKKTQSAMKLSQIHLIGMTVSSWTKIVSSAAFVAVIYDFKFAEMTE
jgi:hypothetical protein